MVCAVWATWGRLGKTIFELYEMFIIHLLTHWETKHMTEERPTMNMVRKQSKPLLLKVGQLANTWEKHNRLKIVFNAEELEDTMDQDFDKVIKRGILTKSYPSYIQESKWSFPHQTIQEFFVAFLIGNDENDTLTDSFTTRCKDIRVLTKCDMIFAFLCSKYPSVANKILTQLLLEAKDEQKCKELFDFICEVYPHYLRKTLDIPLPCYLKLQDDMDDDMMNTLLKSDKRQKQPNLRHLTIEDAAQLEKLIDVPYIEGFSVTIKDEEEKKLVSNKIHKLSKLTSISIESNVSLQSTIILNKMRCDRLTNLTVTVPAKNKTSELSSQSRNRKNMLEKISCDTLKDLSVIAPGALEAVADSIHRFNALQKLHVDDKDDDNRIFLDLDRSYKHRYKILSELKDNDSIKEVSLCVADLGDRIMQEKLNMKVKLKVKEQTLRTDILGQTVRGFDFTGGLYKLDLSGNNLKGEGESLGQLMARMTTLRVLDLYFCNIQADTVHAMVHTIKEIKVTSRLHTLYLGRYKSIKNDNNLHKNSCYLGELVALIPDLHTLDMNDCNLTDKDLVKMSYSLPSTTSIHTLNLTGNNLDHSINGLDILQSQTPYLQDDSSEGSASPLSHTPHLQDDSSEGSASPLSHTPHLQDDSSEGSASPLSHKPHLQDDSSEGLVSPMSHTPHLQDDSSEESASPLSHTPHLHDDSSEGSTSPISSTPELQQGVLEQLVNLLSQQDDNNEGLDSPLSNSSIVQNDSNEGLEKLLSHTQHLQALAVGGTEPENPTDIFPTLPAPITTLCKAADAGSLINLLVLDISFSKLQPGSLKKLGQHLPYLKTIQEIHLQFITGAETEEYKHVYRNLPPSLHYLNVYTTSITQDLSMMLDHQHNLSQLQELNVSLSYSDIDYLQEVLEQHNPNIQVYKDYEEQKWKVHDHDNDEDETPIGIRANTKL